MSPVDFALVSRKDAQWSLKCRLRICRLEHCGLVDALSVQLEESCDTCEGCAFVLGDWSECGHTCGDAYAVRSVTSTCPIDGLATPPLTTDVCEAVDQNNAYWVSICSRSAFRGTKTEGMILERNDAGLKLRVQAQSHHKATD